MKRFDLARSGHSRRYLQNQNVENAKEPLRVFGRRANKEVDVTGESWMPVEGNGVTTDNQVFNAVRVQ